MYRRGVGGECTGESGCSGKNISMGARRLGRGTHTQSLTLGGGCSLRAEAKGVTVLLCAPSG